MDSAVEGDVLRNHLLKLIHDGLDGIPCCNGILFVTSDGDLILEARQQMNDQLWPSLRASVKRYQKYRATPNVKMKRHIQIW